LSRGEFIQWFDSDDIMDLKLLSISVEHMQVNDCEMGVFSVGYFKNNISEFNEKRYFTNEMIGNNPAFDFFTLKQNTKRCSRAGTE
jgi:hypothetical protein